MKPLNAVFRTETVIVHLAALVAAILVVASLEALGVISISFAIAVYVAMLVYPVQKRVNRALPDRFSWVGVSAAMLAFLSAVALFSGMVVFVMSTVAGNIYRHAGGMTRYWHAFMSWAAENSLPLPDDFIRRGEVLSGGVKLVTAGITSAWSLSAMLLMVFFLVLLMLGEADKWDKGAAERAGLAGLPGVTEVIGQISHRVRIFLLLRTAVSVVTGVLGGLWLWLTGTDYALTWGTLIFLLNYIPYIGSITAVIPPTLMALAANGPAMAALALGGLTFINQVTGNYLDPRLEGRIFAMSPTLVFMCVLFWGWVWGAAGAILAVPISITVMTVYSYLSARTAMPGPTPH